MNLYMTNKTSRNNNQCIIWTLYFVDFSYAVLTEENAQAKQKLLNFSHAVTKRKNSSFGTQGLYVYHYSN